MSKIMVSMPDALINQIDQISKEEHRSRSEFLREATRWYLTYRIKQYSKPLDNPRVRKAFQSWEELKDKWTGKWNSTNLIRKIRENR